MIPGAGKWIVGAAIGILAVLGLFMASAARDTGFHVAGLVFFGSGVLFIFDLIRRNSGRN
jgi:hypothetical protein